MNFAANSTDVDVFIHLSAPPIPSFVPFSLLPDELIIDIAKHLPQLKDFPSGWERPWSNEERSIESFASVDKRIRRLALSVRWETVMLRMFASSTPLVLERLSQYGHLVKKLVVHAFSSKHPVTFPQQLDRTVACLSACDNLKDLTLRIYQAGITGGYGSLATVFETLATRASKLEILLIDPTWNSLDGLEQLEDVLSATAQLQKLYIGDRGFKVRYIDDLGCLRCHLQARRIPQLPPLPVLTNLSIPDAGFLTEETFAGTTACTELRLGHVQAGDLARVAKCVGHAVERLNISLLEPLSQETPPPILAVLKRLEFERGYSVCLPALFDPKTPLETLELDQMDDDVFDGLQDFYTQQPRKTLAYINISRPQTTPWDDLWMESEFEVRSESEEEIQERRRLKIASHQVLERCLAWAATGSITIKANWYRPDWSALEMSDVDLITRSMQEGE